jgi:carbonic anhydrase
MKFFCASIVALATSFIAAQSSQSPIDLQSYSVPVANTRNISTIYAQDKGNATHVGDTIKVYWGGGNDAYMKLNGNSYKPKQFHFHAPSEHRVNGKQYPFEMHIVHQDAQGKLAVLGVIFDQADQPSTFLEQVWREIGPLNHEGDSAIVPSVDPSSLKIEDSQYYRYPGSLTTPPFAEGVEWIVLQAIQPISAKQVAAYRAKFPEDSSREPQALNGRKITLFQAQKGKPSC